MAFTWGARYARRRYIPRLNTDNIVGTIRIQLQATASEPLDWKIEVGYA